MTLNHPVTIPACDTPRKSHAMPAFPTLSAEVERALCLQWHDRHSGSAVHLLLSHSVGIIGEIAAAYGQHYRVHADDLVGECYVGLMRAVCRFDPDCGVRFVAYAACRVHEAAQAFILRNWSRLKLGTKAARLQLLDRLCETHARLRALESRTPETGHRALPRSTQEQAGAP